MWQFLFSQQTKIIHTQAGLLGRWGSNYTVGIVVALAAIFLFVAAPSGAQTLNGDESEPVVDSRKRQSHSSEVSHSTNRFGVHSRRGEISSQNLSRGALRNAFFTESSNDSSQSLAVESEQRKRSSRSENSREALRQLTIMLLGASQERGRR